jgi:hypothetical protein
MAMEQSRIEGTGLLHSPRSGVTWSGRYRVAAIFKETLGEPSNRPRICDRMKRVRDAKIALAIG